MADPLPTPNRPYCTPLDAIIGETSRLSCEVSDIIVKGLIVRTWIYRSEDVVPDRPAIVGIHGGPAFTHRYILPLKLLADYGHPVILYDQAGCGASSHVQDPQKSAPWLFTVEYYLEELSAVIDYYNLTQYYLYGSSWGTIIAQEWAVLQPEGLYGIMLDGALCDPHLYIHTQRRDRISTLPSFTQQLLTRIVNSNDLQNPAFPILDETLSKFFLCRQIPWPDAMFESIEGMDRTIYAQMQGDCEFMIGGVLESWSINDRLYLIQVPTLVLVGEYDTMTTECSNAIVDRVATAWPLVTIPRAGHCKLMDEPFLCIEAMSKFLNTVEIARNLRPRKLEDR